MHWTWDEVRALPYDVYLVLVEDLNREFKRPDDDDADHPVSME